MNLANIKIGTRLRMAFGAVLAIMVVMTVFGINRLNALADKTDTLVSDSFKKVELCGTIIRLANANARLVVETQLSENARAVESLVSKQKDGSQQISATFATLDSMVKSDRGKALLAGVHSARTKWLDARERANQLSLAGKSITERGSYLNSAVFPALAEYTDALDSLNEHQGRVAEATAAEGNATYESARTMLIVLGVIGLALGIAFALTITASITKPVAELNAAAEKLALGDVDQHVTIKSTDEIGQLGSAFEKIIGSQKSLADVAARVARGDMSVAVEARSERDILSKSFETVRQTVRGLVADTGKVVQAAQAGSLDARADASKFEGAFQELVQGINGAIDAFARPVNEAQSVLERVAARDLTVRMTGDYKGDHAALKNALNTTLNTLDGALSDVAGSSEQVAAASNQISAGSQTLAEGASEQASSLEEVSASLQELASMTRQNAANAQEARALAERTSTSAHRGVESMGKLSDAMTKIQSSSDATAKIVKTIDEIAFQTNLLALNAAVEAARAGDAGKGFAVVAEEVRNLAMRSAEAAKNTSQLIEDAVANAEGGVAINADVLQQLKEITEQVTKVGAVMNEIAAASEQQRQGVDQITTAVDQMNAVTQQTAANSEESAATAEELSSQADRMRALVEQFSLTNSSSGYPAYTAPRSAPAAPAVRFAANGNSRLARGKNGSNGNGNGTKRREMKLSPVQSPEDVIPFSDDDDFGTLSSF